MLPAMHDKDALPPELEAQLQENSMVGLVDGFGPSVRDLCGVLGREEHARRLSELRKFLDEEVARQRRVEQDLALAASPPARRAANRAERRRAAALARRKR